MTAYLPDSANAQQSLARLMLSLGLGGLDSVRMSVVGPEIVLEGSVPSYALKCKIEEAALSAGFRIQNCLRVIPGVASQPDSAVLPHSPVSEIDPPA